jgi:hypothetical protein
MGFCFSHGKATTICLPGRENNCGILYGKIGQNIDFKAKKSLSLIIFVFGICPVSSPLTKLCKGCVNKFASSAIHSVGAYWLLCG